MTVDARIAGTALIERTDENGVIRNAIVVSESSPVSVDVVGRDGALIMRLNIGATDTPWANIDVIPKHPDMVSRVQSSRTRPGERATNQTSGVELLALDRSLYSIDFVSNVARGARG
jgi:hypothetical protein